VEGATFIRLCGHHVGHRPTFKFSQEMRSVLFIVKAESSERKVKVSGEKTELTQRVPSTSKMGYLDSVGIHVTELLPCPSYFIFELLIKVVVVVIVVMPVIKCKKRFYVFSSRYVFAFLTF